MRRSAWLVVFAVFVTAVIAGFPTVQAQPSRLSHRVGVLFPAVLDPPRIEAIRSGIRQAMGEPGVRVVLDPRAAAGEIDRLPALANELVRTKVDVILAIAPASVLVARDATSSIPIVAMDLETDPVKSGIVASLGRPGGNITGIFLDAPEIAGKWMQMLRDVVPGLRRIAVLWDPSTGREQLESAESVANVLKLHMHRLEARRPAELDDALRTVSAMGAQGLLVLSSPIYAAEAPRIAALALQYKLPSVMLFPHFARSGGLLSYGPDNLDLLRQAGVLVGKILNGAAPATLPAERPTRFRMLVNLRTANALQITLPQSVLVSADEIIR